MAKRGDEGAGGRAAEPVERWAEAEAMEPVVAAESGVEQAQTMPPRHVPELWQMEEIVEEILFRLPPDEPGNLLRASLVCKPWCCLLSDHGFRRRYREFHQNNPPMLGFLHSWSTFAEFVPITDFRPRGPDPRHCYSLCDCRHGRVLLQYSYDDKEFLAVWDPMMGSQRVLCVPEYSETSNTCARVLCAANSCNHDDCHLGPFLVVFVTLHEQEGVAKASVYSSETSNWSSPASLDVGFFVYEITFTAMPSVLVGDALYFLLSRDSDIGILEYDLGKSRLSEIHMLEIYQSACPIAPILMVAQDGRLGLADLYDFWLSVWWREVGPDEVAVWSQYRVIDLKTLLPVGDLEVSTELVGSVEGSGIIFAITDLSTYMIDLGSLTLKELSTELYQREDITWALFPYLSFYSPPAGAGVVAEKPSEAGHGDEEAVLVT